LKCVDNLLNGREDEKPRYHPDQKQSRKEWHQQRNRAKDNEEHA
jgi:hypothetical protein